MTTAKSRAIAGDRASEHGATQIVALMVCVNESNVTLSLGDFTEGSVASVRLCHTCGSIATIAR